MMSEELERLMRNAEHILIDADGVIWRDDQQIPGAVEAVQRLSEKGKTVTLVTNSYARRTNSTKSRRMYAAKCARLGFTALAEGDGARIVTSSAVAAEYVSKKLRSTGVHLIGSVGVAEELQKAKIPLRWYKDADGQMEAFNNDGQRVDTDSIKVDTVIVGYKEGFNYAMLCDAHEQIRYNGCHYVVTNEDLHFPQTEEREIPAVTAAVGRQPHVVGKPNTPMFDFVCGKVFADDKRPQADRILMIGDRLETDIAFANRHNIPSLCVLTGCVKKEMLENINNSELKPTHFTNSIADLLKLDSTCLRYYTTPDLGGLLECAWFQLPGVKIDVCLL